jgi:hypothetical protein
MLANIAGHAKCYIYHGRLWWLFLISVTCPDVNVFDEEGSFSGLSTIIISPHSLPPTAIVQFPFWRDNTPIPMIGTTEDSHWPRKKQILLIIVSQMEQESQPRIRGRSHENVLLHVISADTPLHRSYIYTVTFSNT